MGPVGECSCARIWKAALFVPKDSVVTDPAPGYREVKSKVIGTFGLSAVSDEGKTHLT